MKQLQIMFAALALLCFGTEIASAQLLNPVTPIVNGAAVGPANPLPVATSSLPPAARNFPGCTVGATSTTCLAASTAVTFVQIQNVSASASIACAFGVAAVLNTKTAVQLGAGQSASWGPVTGGVPSGQLNCIASAGSTPLYVEWN